jgi:tetratricopeptide (TPR) repeat protein
MKYFSIILFLFSYHFTQAQFDPEKVNKKAAQLYSKALETAHDGDFKAGIKILQDAVKIDTSFADAYLSMAGMYGQLKNYHEAISTYEKAKKIDSNYFKDYNLPYSIDLAGTGEFQKALDAVNIFLTIPNLNEKSRKSGEYRKQCYSFAVNYAQHNASSAYKFEPRNLGDSINSDVSEYYPTISLDGNKLIFTRRVGNHNEDFYESNLINGEWSKAKGLTGNINTNMNEAAQSVSLDGQIILGICAITIAR